jgi:hypothetical protein
MLTREQFDKLEGWFWYEEAEAMRDSLDHVKDLDGVILEAGSYKGKSAATMASCNSKDKIYCVDPFTWDGGTLDKFKEQTAGYNNIVCIEEDAVKYRSSFNDKIKLLFIDCDHTYELTKKIYDLYLPLVVDGGIILFHDCSPINYDLSKFSLGDTNHPIPGDTQGGWIGPTQLLLEVRKTNPVWVEGARSIHGIMKKGAK